MFCRMWKCFMLWGVLRSAEAFFMFFYSFSTQKKYRKMYRRLLSTEHHAIKTRFSVLVLDKLSTSGFLQNPITASYNSSIQYKRLRRTWLQKFMVMTHVSTFVLTFMLIMNFSSTYVNTSNSSSYFRLKEYFDIILDTYLKQFPLLNI